MSRENWKSGDLDLIAFKSVPAIELLDERFELHESDAANPHNDMTIALTESDKRLSCQREYRFVNNQLFGVEIKQEAN